MEFRFFTGPSWPWTLGQWSGRPRTLVRPRRFQGGKTRWADRTLRRLLRDQLNTTFSRRVAILCRARTRKPSMAPAVSPAEEWRFGLVHIDANPNHSSLGLHFGVCAADADNSLLSRQPFGRRFASSNRFLGKNADLAFVECWY